MLIVVTLSFQPLLLFVPFTHKSTYSYVIGRFLRLRLLVSGFDFKLSLHFETKSNNKPMIWVFLKRIKCVWDEERASSSYAGSVNFMFSAEKH